MLWAPDPHSAEKSRTMDHPPLVSPRSVFDPDATAAGGPATVPVRTWRSAALAYYRDPLSWLALLVSAVLLSYVGGAAMFWFHSIELGEGGPAISWQAHWLLDSTVGFLALSPALLLIIPAAILAADTYFPARRRLHALVYAGVAGGLFALLTVPGPVAHDRFVGRGTWLAGRVTELIGDPSAPLGPHHDYPVLADLTQQFGFGIPLYVALTVLSVPLIRKLATVRRGRWTLHQPTV